MARPAHHLQREAAAVGHELRFQRGLFEGLPFPAALLDPTGQVVELNPAWKKGPSALLNTKLAAGVNFFQQAAEHRLFADNPDAPASLWAVLGGTADGRVVELPALSLRLHVAPVYEGEVRGLMLVAETTVSKATSAPDEASPARRLEGLATLAGGIAHDFNNLLTTMLGYTHLALADLPPDSTVRDFLLQVEKSARRAADLTQQLLAYAGRDVFTFQPVGMSDFIRELAPLLQSIVERRHTLELSLHEPLPRIQGAPQHLRQIVINLVTNAMEALEGMGGTITVCTSFLHVDQPAAYSSLAGSDATPGPYVVLEVQDTGRGMTRETLSRLFDPFFSTKFTGRGLGMAAVWGIVRSHRGLIKVDSAPGQGTTFQVLFPAQARR